MSIKYMIFNHWKVFYQIFNNISNIFLYCQAMLAVHCGEINRLINSDSYHLITVVAILNPKQNEMRYTGITLTTLH